jgi:hypothetical protein
MLLLGFGLIFQLPVVILLLVRGGILRTAALRKHRPAVLIGILVLAAILTPPDVISQCMMAIPAYLFFELSLLFASRLEKKRQEQEKQEEKVPQRQEEENSAEPIPAADIPAETPKENWRDDTEIPDVYTRHRRGIRQGRPRRYR